MKVKFLCSKLEYKLKEKFPDVMLEEVYFSRRRKYIHMAFEKTIYDFERKKEFFKEVENFYNEYLKKDFELIKPMKIINTIKWKFDYLVFRKRWWNCCKYFIWQNWRFQIQNSNKNVFEFSRLRFICRRISYRFEKV